jgi:PAS domain-containing protein
MSPSPSQDERGSGVSTVDREITELKRREVQLGELVESVERARDEALQAQTQLSEAIEAISEGFVVFDKDRRLVLCNSTYRQYYADAVGQEIADMVVPGAAQMDFLAAAFEAGMFPDIEGTTEDFIAQRHRRQHLQHARRQYLCSRGPQRDPNTELRDPTLHEVARDAENAHHAQQNENRAPLH